MKLSELKPSPALRPWISRYWSWQDEGHLPSLLPGGGAELFFYYQRPVGIIRTGERDISQHHSALLLPRDNLFHFHISAPVSFIAVRFRIGALRHFSPLPETELIDTHLHPAEIWGNDIHRLEEQMSGPLTLAERVRLIEHFLLAKFQLHRQYQHPWLDEVVRRMYYHQQTVTQQELVLSSGFSTRYFQQVFRQHYGIAPRHFQRILRLEQLTRHLLLNREKNYLDSALAHGYYDQSHFIHDFRHFTGTTPSRFFQEANFSAHFYNPPGLR